MDSRFLISRESYKSSGNHRFLSSLFFRNFFVRTGFYNFAEISWTKLKFKDTLRANLSRVRNSDGRSHSQRAKILDAVETTSNLFDIDIFTEKKAS